MPPEPCQNMTSYFHASRWTRILPARGKLASRRDLKSLRRREFALAPVEAPKAGGEKQFRRSHEENVEATVTAGFGPFFGHRCGDLEHFIGIRGDNDHIPGPDIVVEIRLPRDPLGNRDFPSKHKMAQGVCELEPDERVDDEAVRTVPEELECRRGVVVRAEKRNQETGVRASHGNGGKSIGTAYFLEQLVQITLRENRFAIAASKCGALGPIDRRLRCRWRGVPTFHHHIVALLDPSHDRIQVVPEILKRGRFHTHIFSCRPNPVKT